MRHALTEKEVAFSTAAAVPVQPTALRWWSKATGVALAAMHRMFLTSTSDCPPRQEYPKRYAFLAYFCLAREMDRL